MGIQERTNCTLGKCSAPHNNISIKSQNNQVGNCKKSKGYKQTKGNTLQREEEIYSNKTQSSNKAETNNSVSDEDDSDDESFDAVEKSESENESDDDEESETCSGSEEISCFGDDESGSQSSVEQWKEINVEKEVLDKIIVIKQPGEKPHLNLEVIGELKGRTLSTDSYVFNRNRTNADSNQPKSSIGNINLYTENYHAKKKDDANKIYTNGKKSVRNNATESLNSNLSNAERTKLPKNKEKAVLPHNEIKTDRHIPKGLASRVTESKSEHVKNKDNTRSTKGDSAISTQSKMKVFEDDKVKREINSESEHASEDESNSDDQKDSGDSDNVTESDTASIHLSNMDTLSVKRNRGGVDSGYSEKTLIPIVDLQMKVKQTEPQTLDRRVDPKYDTQSITSTKTDKLLATDKAKTTYHRHKTEITSRHPVVKRNERKVNNEQRANHTKYGDKSKISKQEHIEKLKRIYKEQVKVKGSKFRNFLEKPSQSLPDVNTTPKNSASYSMENVTHSDGQRAMIRKTLNTISSANLRTSHQIKSDKLPMSKKSKGDVLLAKRRSNSQKESTKSYIGEDVYPIMNLKGIETEKDSNATTLLRLKENQQKVVEKRDGSPKLNKDNEESLNPVRNKRHINVAKAKNKVENINGLLHEITDIFDKEKEENVVKENHQLVSEKNDSSQNRNSGSSYDSARKLKEKTKAELPFTEKNIAVASKSKDCLIKPTETQQTLKPETPNNKGHNEVTNGNNVVKNINSLHIEITEICDKNTEQNVTNTENHESDLNSDTSIYSASKDKEQARIDCASIGNRTNATSKTKVDTVIPTETVQTNIPETVEIKRYNEITNENDKMKNINSFHNEITEIFDKDTEKITIKTGQTPNVNQSELERQQILNKSADLRRGLAMKELAALHGDSSDSQDDTYGMDKTVTPGHSSKLNIDRTKGQSSKRNGDLRRELAMKEMAALHGGSSDSQDDKCSMDSKVSPVTPSKKNFDRIQGTFSPKRNGDLRRELAMKEMEALHGSVLEMHGDKVGMGNTVSPGTPIKITTGKMQGQPCKKNRGDGCRELAMKEIEALHGSVLEMNGDDVGISNTVSPGTPKKINTGNIQSRPCSKNGDDCCRELAIKEMAALHDMSVAINDCDSDNIASSEVKNGSVQKTPSYATHVLVVDKTINTVPLQSNKTTRMCHNQSSMTYPKQEPNTEAQPNIRGVKYNNLSLADIVEDKHIHEIPNQKFITNREPYIDHNAIEIMNNTAKYRASSAEEKHKTEIVPNGDVQETFVISNTGQSDTDKYATTISRQSSSTPMEINRKLAEKRSRFKTTRTYENFYENKLSKSYITNSRKIESHSRTADQVTSEDDQKAGASTISRTDIRYRVTSDNNQKASDVDQKTDESIGRTDIQHQVTSGDDQQTNAFSISRTEIQDRIIPDVDQKTDASISRTDIRHRLKSNGDQREHEDTLARPLNNSDDHHDSDSNLTVVEYILELVVKESFQYYHKRLEANRQTNRCTALDDDGNEILCCILQAPENKVDPSSFTCEVIDPLDVPPITKRHELLISHVIKFCTHTIGHIAKEREMVAKIPIAHFFVEPWQEVIIREVNKSGQWIDTGEDADIVQIPDMGNVVYGVQIALKELTYVAVITRPRITTVALEYKDKILTSPSDSRVKLRVPGTSDPRRVTLQSIPISEQIIKQFENTRGPEITSYLTAASPMVILSLEGANPESFSFAVPFTSVNYVDDYMKEIEAKNKEIEARNKEMEENDENKDDSEVSVRRPGSKTVDKKDLTEPEDVPNVPPRVRKRMESEIEKKMLPSEQKPKDKSRLQELESKVHKREKERYLIQLVDGNDRSIQIKLLDDSDRIKIMDIETESPDEMVKFSVYDTYARLFAVEVHDIINFREIQASVKGLANYLLKHRVRINVNQNQDNPYSVKFSASVHQPFRQRWPTEKHGNKPAQEDTEGVRFLELTEGDAIGLSFRGNIEVSDRAQKVFSFHGYRGINSAFDLAVKDSFSQKSLPEFHGAVQVFVLKRPRLRSINKSRMQNVSSDWDLFTEYHFLLPKYLKKTPIIINRAPISLRFQEPLTVDFVRQMCKELIKDWDTFAFGLGISNARIQAIKQHNRNQISERVLMDVIVSWMKQQPVARDKVGPVLAALRICRKPDLENELLQRHKALKDSRTRSARDKHIQRAALAVCQSRSVTVRWRQLLGYLLHLETDDVKVCEVTSEFDEQYKNDATKCYHALQYWKSISGSPSIWKVIDALRHCNCLVAANTLRVQEYKRLY